MSRRTNDICQQCILNVVKKRSNDGTKIDQIQPQCIYMQLEKKACWPQFLYTLHKCCESHTTSVYPAARCDGYLHESLVCQPFDIYVEFT